MSCILTAICCLAYAVPSKLAFKAVMAKVRHCGAVLLIYHELRPEPRLG